MERVSFLMLAITMASACATSANHPSAIQFAPATELGDIAISAVLDDWHDAAAQADEERYFSHFAAGGIFLGTDATERWTVSEFREYAHPHFERGRAWTFRATRRHVNFASDEQSAFFDEELDTEGLGPARGSGVMVRVDGVWKIAQYNLTITVPNERFAEVKALLEQAAATPGPE